MPLPPGWSLAGDWLRISSVASPGSLACRVVMSAASWARAGFAAAGVVFAAGLPRAAGLRLGADADVTTSATAAAAAPTAATLTPAVRRVLHRGRRPGAVVVAGAPS